jgi:xanthine dehydrogenase YagS FAD-binding subunit
MRAFEYARAETIDQALSNLGHDGQVRVLAGGTDLLPLMKSDIAAPARLIDIKRVTDLASGVADRGADGVLIGALTPLSVLEQDPLLRSRFAALAEAAGLAATPQLRNMATIGGNLLQRPRCWYYRSSLFNCWLKGGETCQARDGQSQYHAVFQESPCVAVHPSDPASALLALDASVRVRGPRGERMQPLSEFLIAPTDDHRRETTLAEDELITAIVLANPKQSTRSTYVKAMNRQVWAFALAGVAAALRIDSGRISHARLVLGGVAPVPHRALGAEQVLLGSEPVDAVFERAATEAVREAQPLPLNAYKLALTRGLIHQALRALVVH